MWGKSVETLVPMVLPIKRLMDSRLVRLLFWSVSLPLSASLYLFVSVCHTRFRVCLSMPHRVFEGGRGGEQGGFTQSKRSQRGEEENGVFKVLLLCASCTLRAAARQKEEDAVQKQKRQRRERPTDI